MSITVRQIGRRWVVSHVGKTNRKNLGSFPSWRLAALAAFDFFDWYCAGARKAVVS